MSVSKRRCRARVGDHARCRKRQFAACVRNVELHIRSVGHTERSFSQRLLRSVARPHSVVFGPNCLASVNSTAGRAELPNLRRAGPGSVKTLNIEGWPRSETVRKSRVRISWDIGTSQKPLFAPLYRTTIREANSYQRVYHSGHPRMPPQNA